MSFEWLKDDWGCLLDALRMALGCICDAIGMHLEFIGIYIHEHDCLLQFLWIGSPSPRQFLTWKPPPHDFEHWLHSPKSSFLQAEMYHFREDISFFKQIILLWLDLLCVILMLFLSILTSFFQSVSLTTKVAVVSGISPLKNKVRYKTPNLESTTDMLKM